MGECEIPESRSASQITIPIEEYKEMIRVQVKVELFETFVNSQKFSISKEECARFFGFRLECAREKL